MEQTSSPDHASLLERVAAPPNSPLPLPKLLIILAHPDDEVLALGGRLERLRLSTLLCCTDGAPSNGADARAHGLPSTEAYRQARRRELADALRLAHLPESCGRPLLIAGTGGKPCTISDQDAVFHLAAIARTIAREILAARPEAVVTHPYEGGHPDHDSCAFSVQAALQLIQPMLSPVHLEAPFYHAGPAGMRTGQFLDEHPAAPGTSISISLSPSEQQSKRARLACFTTQQQTLAQFAVEEEQFRLAPQYDFSLRPHPGQLFYERFPWGVSWDHFRAQAEAASVELGLAATDSDRRP